MRHRWFSWLWIGCLGVLWTWFSLPVNDARADKALPPSPSLRPAKRKADSKKKKKKKARKKTPVDPNWPSFPTQLGNQPAPRRTAPRNVTPAPRPVPDKAATPKPAPQRPQPRRKPHRHPGVLPPPVVPPPMSPVRSPLDTDATQGRIGGGIGLELLDGDWFLTLDLAFEIQKGPFAGGFQVPLRLRIIDNEPTTSDDIGGILRKQDWDHWTDFARAIRYLRWGQKSNPYRFKVGDFPMAVYARLGDLVSATLGHGTLLYHYYNNLNPDRYNLGLELDVHTAYGGIEFVMNSILDPSVAGGRVYVRPVTFFAPQNWWTRLAVGFTIAGDGRAPYTLKTALPQESDVTLNDQYVNEARGLSTVGFDVDLALLRLSWVSLSPYMDLNFLTNTGGVGFHLGILSIFRFKVPVMNFLQLHTRAEYRAMGKGYEAQYFNSIYDTQKYGLPFQRATAGKPFTEYIPKLRALEDTRKDAISGFYGEVALKLGNWVTIGVTFDEYEGPDNGNLTLFVQVPTLQWFQLGAYYTKRGFDGLGELFSLDENSLLTAEVRIPLWKYFSVQVLFQRVWQPENNNGELSYKPIDNFQVRFGAFYTF